MQLASNVLPPRNGEARAPEVRPGGADESLRDVSRTGPSRRGALTRRRGRDGRRYELTNVYSEDAGRGMVRNFSNGAGDTLPF